MTFCLSNAGANIGIILGISYIACEFSFWFLAKREPFAKDKGQKVPIVAVLAS
jgi:hypothetical protein